MPTDTVSDRALSTAQIEQFITDGFVRLDDAFPRTLAEAVQARLWRDMSLDPGDPAGWIRPVVRLGMYREAPFVEAANTPVVMLSPRAPMLSGTGGPACARSATIHNDVTRNLPAPRISMGRP